MTLYLDTEAAIPLGCASVDKCEDAGGIGSYAVGGGTCARVFGGIDNHNAGHRGEAAETDAEMRRGGA